MHRLAMTVATMGFFVFAAVGAAHGCAPFVCAWRALAGAAILFMVVTVAMRIVAGVLAGAITNGSGAFSGRSEKGPDPHKGRHS
jgi:hypothetical protein